ncbi:MAG: anti-sigma factor family protein [Longimicrobiales bacterium]
MSHFTEGVLQAYLDDEVAADARGQVTAHVGECAACATLLQDLRELSDSFSSAVAVADIAPIPTAALAELRLRAEQRTWRERFRGLPTHVRRAAIVVLGVTTVGVAAVPGSPVRDYLIEVWHSLTSSEPAPVEPPAAVQEPAGEPDTPIGIGVSPTDGRIQILLVGQANGTSVYVTLTDSVTGRVKALNGAAPRFNRRGAGTLEVRGGSGQLHIELPRTLVAGQVEVDGRVYVTTEGGSLRFHGPDADTVNSTLKFTPRR